MARQKKYILKVKDGKKTREFEFNSQEYNEFLQRYEENELIEAPDDLSGFKVTMVNPKTGKPINTVTL